MTLTDDAPYTPTGNGYMGPDWTPDDTRAPHEFKEHRTLRWNVVYEAEEVDGYLASVAADHADREAQVKALEADNDRLRAAADSAAAAVLEMERRSVDLAARGQRAADTLIADARAQAATIVTEAHRRAARIVDDAQQIADQTIADIPDVPAEDGIIGEARQALDLAAEVRARAEEQRLAAATALELLDGPSVTVEATVIDPPDVLPCATSPAELEPARPKRAATRPRTTT